MKTSNIILWIGGALMLAISLTYAINGYLALKEQHPYYVELTKKLNDTKIRVVMTETENLYVTIPFKSITKSEGRVVHRELADDAKQEICSYTYTFCKEDMRISSDTLYVGKLELYAKDKDLEDSMICQLRLPYLEHIYYKGREIVNVGTDVGTSPTYWLPNQIERFK